MSKTNVLIFPAGEINSVELHDALSHNVNVELFGCSSQDRHGGYIFKNYKSGIPNIMDDNFLEKFNELIEDWNIDFIFPTHDTVALYLAEKQNHIHAKVIVAPTKTAEICRDKNKTYDHFADCKFCPRRYKNFDTLPVFIKPRFGQGAKGAKCVKNKNEIPLDFVMSDYVITEFLPGEEMTVDCVTDSKGKLCACLPRVRNRLLAGVCVAGVSMEPSDEIIQIAKEINKRLDFFGLWYFQVKRSIYGSFKLMEISVRCAGTMCLSRARGVNLPLLSVYVAQGKNISVFENPFTVRMDRTLISRYSIDYKYDTVYIDYDDTIVNNDKVCLTVIKFLYQCKNNGIKVVMITRHEEYYDDSVIESLYKHAIPETLFERIIKLRVNQNKCDYIEPKGAIFVDNAYGERKAVHDRYGIPVFDIEGIEVLDDWRC